MTQVAVPVLSVVPGARFGSVEGEGDRLVGDGLPRGGLVSTAETGVGDEKLPLTGWMARVDGVAVVTTAGRRHLHLVVHREAKRAPECVSICCCTAPVAMSTSQTLPEVESPVQNEVPSGSRLMANSWPWQPGSDAQV